MAPDFNAAEKINSKLSKIENLSADGRPILGLDAKELQRIVLEASEDAMLIPRRMRGRLIFQFSAQLRVLILLRSVLKN